MHVFWYTSDLCRCCMQVVLCGSIFGPVYIYSTILPYFLSLKPHHSHTFITWRIVCPHVRPLVTGCFILCPGWFLCSSSSPRSAQPTGAASQPAGTGPMFGWVFVLCAEKTHRNINHEGNNMFLLNVAVCYCKKERMTKQGTRKHGVLHL